jgi:hypothetical protein
MMRMHCHVKCIIIMFICHAELRIHIHMAYIQMHMVYIHIHAYIYIWSVYIYMHTYIYIHMVYEIWCIMFPNTQNTTSTANIHRDSQLLLGGRRLIV